MKITLGNYETAIILITYLPNFFIAMHKMSFFSNICEFNLIFLGLFINNNLSWKTHIECIKSKLSSACYAMRSVKSYVTINTLKMIQYSYFHSVMTYGLLFWGSSPDSIKIFRLQKKIIRIMMGCRSRDSCTK
jgi:hypothetical protein